MRTTLNLDQFFFPVHWQMKSENLFFYKDHGILYVWKSLQRSMKERKYCTTLMGLPDLASDGSPLFAEPMFLFGWALCNTSTYYMLTFSLSCVNYALRGEFPFLHRLLQYIFTYALFWLPRVCLSLKKQLPYYTISFSWNKRLLEPKFLCDECSVNLYNFFCERNNTFP